MSSKVKSSLVLLLALAPLAAHAGGTKIERKARKPAAVVKRMTAPAPAATRIARKIVASAAAVPKTAVDATIEIDEGD